MPKLVTLSSVAATTCCCRRVRSKSVSAGFGGCGGCRARRTRACRPCAMAAGEAPALHLEHCAAVLYGQSNLFDRIFRGTSTSIPPTASTKLLEAVEVDEDHVVDVEAGEVMTVRARAQASDLVRGVDLGEPHLGDLDLEVPRDREVGEATLPGSARSSMIESPGSLPRGRRGRRRRSSSRGCWSVSTRSNPSRSVRPLDAAGHALVRRRNAARHGEVAATPHATSRPSRRARASTIHRPGRRGLRAGVGAGCCTAGGRSRGRGGVARERHPPLTLPPR